MTHLYYKIIYKKMFQTKSLSAYKRADTDSLDGISHFKKKQQKIVQVKKTEAKIRGHTRHNKN